MILDPTIIIPIGVGVTAFITTITAVFLLVNAPNERLARILGYSLLAWSMWGWFSFGFHRVEDLWIARELSLLAMLFQIFGQIFHIKYAYIYLSQKRDFLKPEKFLYWLLITLHAFFFIIVAMDLFGTQFMAETVGSSGDARLAPMAGPLLIWFLGLFIAVPASIAWIMSRRIIQETGEVRRVGTILAVSLSGAYLLGTTGFLLWYGLNSYLGFLHALALPFLIVLSFYTIANYQLFNVRTVAAELLVFVMWGFLFWRTILNESIVEALPDASLLIAMIIIGLLFIKSITHELSVRIKLEEVSEQLRVLNNSLETEVEKRTESLTRAKIHTETVVEHLPIGLLEVLSDATLVRINQTAAEILGIQAQSARGINALSHPALTSILGSQIVPGLREIHLSTPKSMDVEVTISPLTLEEGIGHIIIINDVTERRALERAKNDFVATAAHQLRTPLSAIKWTFELLKTEKLTESQREIVEKGSSGIDNMTHIAEGLMMSIRTAEGISKYTFTNTDITPTIKNSVHIVEPLAEQKNITLDINIPEKLPTVSIDSDRILAATQNLLDNAIKYTPDNGSVSLNITSDMHFITVSITDTGIGISEKDQEHIFEKFFRSHKATEISTDGSGLGLSIVKSIITAHGGTLSFTSKPGSGSTFTYTIPVHHSPVTT